MKNYQKQLGKLTLASLLLTSPVFVALSPLEVQAATTTSEMENIFDTLPPVENITIKENGAAVYKMHVAYTALSSANKKMFTEKYNAVVAKVIVEMQTTYEDPNIVSGGLNYFTNRFVNTMKLIEGIPTAMKSFDAIVLSDKQQLTNLNTYLTAMSPYYEAYVQETTSYTAEEIRAAYNKVMVLSNTDSLEQKLNKLPQIDTLSIDNSKEFKTAQTAYTTLLTSSYLELAEPSAAIKRYKEYENVYKELEANGPASEILSVLKEIGTVEKVAIADCEKIERAYALYSPLLIEEVKETIDYELLEKMRAKVWQLIAQELDLAIQNLQTVDAIKVENESELKRIQNAYNELVTPNAKGYVTNYELFLEMQNRLSQLKTAQSLEEKIQKLPKLDAIGLESDKEITQIRQELNQLDVMVQKGIPAYEQFLALENKLMLVKQQDLALQIDSELTNLTNPPVKTAVQSIVKKYEELTAINKTKITRKKEIAQAISKVAALETDLSKSQSFYNLVAPFMQNLSVDEKNFAEYENWLQYERNWNSYTEQLRAVDKIENDINQLPFTKNLEEVDYNRVNRVFEEYQALSDDAKILVPTEYREKLTELITIVYQKQSEKEITYVEELITAISPQVSLDDARGIERARTAYEKLTKQQKEAVLKYQVLVEAEENLLELKKMAQDKEDEKKQQALHVFAEEVANLETKKLDVTDQEKIRSLRKFYNELTMEEQVNITNIKKLTDAERTLENLFTQVANLEEIINNLDPLKNAVAVSNARNLYNTLTNAQKSLVRNIETLELFEFFIKEGLSSTDKAMNEKIEAALATQNSALPNSVYDLINALPVVDKLTLENQLEVMKAKEIYDQLPIILQNKVGNRSKLIELETKMAQLKKEALAKTENIDALITKLPSEMTLIKQQEIDSILQEIDKLSTVEQAYLKNYDVLLVIQENLADFQEQELKKIKNIILSIQALPSTQKLTLNYEGIVEELQQAYEHLTKEQKSKVTNIDKLISVQQQMKTLQNSSEAAVDKEDLEKVTGILTVPALTNMTTKFSGKATPNSQIIVYNGKKKIATVKVTAKGTYTLTIPKQSKKTQLKLVVQYKNKTIKTVSKVIQAAKVKAATSLKATTKKVTGKATKNTTVKIYKGNKLLKSVKVNSKGTFQVAIAKQKMNTKLNVYVYDSVKNRSAVKKVTVK